MKLYEAYTSISSDLLVQEGEQGSENVTYRILNFSELFLTGNATKKT